VLFNNFNYTAQRNTTGFIYTSIDAPPSFAASATTTITSSVGSALESGELSGKRNILISNPFNERLRPNGLSGTVGSPYRFKSESDSVRSWIGGDVVATGQQVIATLNDANYQYYYHLGVKGNSSTGVTGIGGVAASARVGGANFFYDDIIVKDVSFAGFQINEGSTGQSYTYLSLVNCRVFGYNVEGEGIYLGNTSKTIWSNIDNIYIRHLLLTNKGRDGFQVNNCLNLDVKNVTVYNVGIDNAASQRALVQVQNSQGVIENCIFWGAPEFGTISAHGLTFKNCYFYATVARGFWSKLTSNYSAPIGTLNQPNYFINCHFGSAVALSEAWIIQEDECDFIFSGCTKDSNITNLIADNRTDKVTYSITQTGTATAASVEPTFLSMNVDDEDTHGCLTSTLHYNNHQGYRTP
jgi:hypothetical protein